jgi:hemolysin activation/secretion protein
VAQTLLLSYQATGRLRSTLSQSQQQQKQQQQQQQQISRDKKPETTPPEHQQQFPPPDDEQQHPGRPTKGEDHKDVGNDIDDDYVAEAARSKARSRNTITFRRERKDSSPSPIRLRPPQVDAVTGISDTTVTAILQR